jgi:A/G-specific adenine glycosylase
MLSIPEGRKAEFQRLLLSWWKDNMDEFPWRLTSDPYRILVAEILLRKTSRAQVVAVYEALLQQWPSPSDLARASEDKLRDYLRPLGMENKRAKLLVELGQAVVHRFGGRIPDNLDDLMSLPGVGRYAASAVLCLAYGQDQPMVDTNVVRVIQRVFGYESPKARPRDDRILWQIAAGLIPQGRARDYNLALIDLAGAVCQAQKPACPTCPLKEVCLYGATK